MSSMQPAGSAVDHITDEQVTAFLSSTNPCYVYFPTDMRAAVREYLERSLANGELTLDQLAHIQRDAGLDAMLGD